MTGARWFVIFVWDFLDAHTARVEARVGSAREPRLLMYKSLESWGGLAVKNAGRGIGKLVRLEVTRSNWNLKPDSRGSGSLNKHQRLNWRHNLW
jgi:hypothetical protein